MTKEDTAFIGTRQLLLVRTLARGLTAPLCCAWSANDFSRPRARREHSSIVTSAVSFPFQFAGALMKLDLLAIAPHPDDVELTCGGTLLKMADAGYRTGIVDLTQGETGTRGTPQIRTREAANAAKILRVQIRRNAGLPDAQLRVTDEYKTVIAEIIRELRPHTVILPYWQGRHPDHYTAATLGYEACFIAGLRNYRIAGEAYRPFKIIYAAAYSTVTPTFAVDITKQYDRRRRAILSYLSQFTPRKSGRTSKVFLPLDELEDRMSLMARHYGRMIGVKYAEGFVMKEVMQVDDVVQMPVRSI
jgi:N-acetylglucosamine malate deacetylase 1